MPGGKATTFDNDLLKLIFNGTPIANIADNAASSPLTNFYVSFHNADPGVGGSQTTSETAYTSYARTAVPRTSVGWTVTGNQVVPAANVNAPLCTGGTDTLTFFSVGIAASGTGKILYRGPLSPTISVNSGVTPQLQTGTVITEN